MAAEQPWMVALGASPGNLADDTEQLRSSDVKPRWNLRRCSAAQVFWVPMTCGFTAGYLTPLLRSESQADHHSTNIPVGNAAGVRSNAVKNFSWCFHRASRSPFSPWQGGEGGRRPDEGVCCP